MSARVDNLRRLLNPRHIAVIGGDDAAISARQCAAQFDGPVWGVNPTRNNLGGVRCFGSVAELPEAPDAVFLATPRAVAAPTLAELNARGAGGVACFTAGYAELGESGRAAERELVASAGDMALVGPNCYGLVNYANGAILWPFGAGDTRCEKGIALVMQSGMIPANLTMNERSVPISIVISAGNQAMLAIEDYLDVLVDDDRVTAVGMYIEGIRDIRKFATAALKALRADKPLVVMKAGSSPLGQALAVSHTGSLSGTEQAFEAYFDRLGVIRVQAPVEMMETLKFLSVSGTPQGRRIAAFTCSGGEAALLADYSTHRGLDLAQPSARARKRLQKLLPDIATVSNPLDYTTPLWGNRKIMPDVFASLVGDGYDAAIVIQDFPPPHIHADDSKYRSDAESFIEACAAQGIPAASCCDLPENIDRVTRELLIAGGVTPLQGFEAGLDALANACAYGVRRQRILQRENASEFSVIEVPGTSNASRVLNEWQAKQLVRQHCIEVPPGCLFGDGNVDLDLEGLEFPLVVKAVAAGLAHKSELGALRIGQADADAVRESMREIKAAIDGAQPPVALEGFLVENMIDDVIAEMLVGINTDAQFGQTLVIGSGGVLVELIHDSVTLLLPASRAQIRDAIGRLRVSRLLDGFRGGVAADLDAVVSTISAVAGFAQSHRSKLLELDINPLLITPYACIAADVMLREVDPDD